MKKLEKKEKEKSERSIGMASAAAAVSILCRCLLSVSLLGDFCNRQVKALGLDLSVCVIKHSSVYQPSSRREVAGSRFAEQRSKKNGLHLRLSTSVSNCSFIAFFCWIVHFKPETSCEVLNYNCLYGWWSCPSCSVLPKQSARFKGLSMDGYIQCPRERKVRHDAVLSDRFLLW